MRRLALTLMVAPLALCAQDAAPRFAFFSMGLLTQKSVQAGRVFKEFEVARTNFEEKRRSKAEEGQRIESQLQSGSLSDEGREKLLKQHRDLQYEFKKLQEDGQAELQKIEGKVSAELNRIVSPVVEQLAKEQKLQFVFTDNAQQVLQFTDRVWATTFTDEVARRLDATEPAGAAGAKPAPKPTPKPAAPAKKG